MPFEHYIQKGAQRLRMGYTTGTCATLAAKAAATMLLGKIDVGTVSIMTPKGLTVEADVLDITRSENAVSCAVRKDAGDDPDITDGMLVYARVSKNDSPGIVIDGGDGVGRVTRPGLDQPVGAAAINSVPRRMIESAVQDVCDSSFCEGGLSVIISLPDGERLAKRTFNPKLGIAGGLSVIGTSGIVEPMSTQALIDTIGLEIRALGVSGETTVVLTPGNYGKRFISEQPDLAHVPTVKCANFIGDAIDFAVYHNFKEILLVGHAGKFVKLAGGILNTHSSVADCRSEIVTAHAALCGADTATTSALMHAITTDQCFDILDGAGLKNTVVASLLNKADDYVARRAGDDACVGVVMFGTAHGLLGQTQKAAIIINKLKRRNI